MSSQEDFGNPTEGDNTNLEGKDLRSRLSLYINLLVWFTVLLGAIALIASTVMSSIVYSKHEDKLGDEKKLALWTPITCGIGFLLLFIFFLVFYLRFNPKLKAEDEFLTSMTRVATEPISISKIKNNLTNYLNAALKTKDFKTGDIERFGRLLNTPDDKSIYELSKDEMPKYLYNRLGNNIRSTQEIMNNASDRENQSYISGWNAAREQLKKDS